MANHLRSRSRSPHTTWPLKVCIPFSLVTHFSEPHINSNISSDSRISRIKFYQPYESGDGIMEVHSQETSAMVTALNSILTEFITQENIDLSREGIKIIIPSSSVSLVIGRAGKQIKKFQEDTNTTISILDDKKSSSGKKEVLIKGAGRDIEHAVEKILELISDNKERKQPTGKCSVRFLVNKEKAELGRNEQLVKRMHRIYSVNLKTERIDRVAQGEGSQVLVKHT